MRNILLTAGIISSLATPLGIYFKDEITSLIPIENYDSMKRKANVPRPLEKMCTTRKVSERKVPLNFNEKINCLNDKARTEAKN